MNNKINIPQTDTNYSLVVELIEQLNLSGFEISLTEDLKNLSILKSFKKVELPLKFLSEKRWLDIRQKMRSQIDSSPQLNNFGAQNEWERGSW